MIFENELKQRVEEVEKIIRQFLPKEEGTQKNVIEAMNYSVNAGGKRLRPMLMLETYKMLGGSGKIVEPFMAALEMIHTYSLVHDDLPAMDNDEYRRGKKTTHAVYGEAMGILAGDSLLNFAFETALLALDISLDEKTAKALQILAGKAGIYGMIGGQVADIESEGKQISVETLEFIHTMKCGALIEAAMLIGAVLAGASKEILDKVFKIASNVGMAFQIRDDILDVTSTAEILGKPINSDEKNNKCTYVTVKGIEQAKKDVDKLSDEAVDILNSISDKNEFLRELIISLTKREF